VDLAKGKRVQRATLESFKFVQIPFVDSAVESSAEDPLSDCADVKMRSIATEQQQECSHNFKEK
jgi:hypothetical protein